MQQQLIQFFTTHWFLTAAFVSVLVVTIGYEIYIFKKGVPRISPQEAVLLMNREDAMVIDSRDGAAFKSGHIVGAENIMLKDLASHLTKLEKYKDTPVIISCAMGQHSPAIAEHLRKNGFHKVSIITGGISAWQAAGLPLAK